MRETHSPLLCRDGTNRSRAFLRKKQKAEILKKELFKKMLILDSLTINSTAEIS